MSFESTRNAALVLYVKDFLNYSVEDILQLLKRGVQTTYITTPTEEEELSWKDYIPKLKRVIKHLNPEILLALEYSVGFNNERADVVLIGENEEQKPTAIILEIKAWSQAKRLDNGWISAHGKERKDPWLQVSGYRGRMSYSTATEGFVLEAAVWLYKLPRTSILFPENTPVFFKDEESKLQAYLCSKLVGSTNKQVSQRILETPHHQNRKLWITLNQNAELVKNLSLEALATQGFEPSEAQLSVIYSVLRSIRQKKRKAFFIKGRPGSGKSYLAILLLLQAANLISEIEPNQHNQLALAYRNNRLLYTVKRIFSDIDPGLAKVLAFFSTKNKTGLADKSMFSPDHALIVCDEAQRLAKFQIESILSRGKIVVFFYDEEQILNPEEEGSLKNFEEVAKKRGVSYESISLPTVHRTSGGEAYYEFVEKLLNLKLEKKDFLPADLYDLRIFEDPRDMLNALEERRKSGHQVALIASFTESNGRGKNKLRIGYPLPSGYEGYKGTDLTIQWLMDPESEYPDYWLNKNQKPLHYCSSIYGCQGFEADFVGIFWGRDLVIRNGRFSLGENCEDDVGKPPLKKWFWEAKESGNKILEEKVLHLLKNRYRIFLSRGIRGSYIYAEDFETRLFLLNLLKQNAS